MKKSIIILITSILCISAANGCKSIVTFDAMPANAQAFLTEFFPDSPVSYAVKECNEYEVILTNGVELEFNEDGEWKKVDMNNKAIPAGIIATLPPSIPAFLSTSFANVSIEKVEKGHFPAYKVELLNGIEVEFNSKGICKKIDD